MFGCLGENFANSVSEILVCTVEVVKRNEMHVLRLFLKDELWKGHFLGWINTEYYEKTVHDI